MAVRVISNPIINSPYRIPVRHFAFDNDGITDRIVQGRQESSYFVPVPRSRKRGVHQQHSHPITPCRPLLRKVTVPRYRDPTGDALNAESERVASRLIRRGVSARSANSGRHQPRPASGRSGLRRARRASGGDGDQVCGWLNPLGSARWTRSPCALHTICNRPAQAGGYVLPESTRRAGPDAAGEIRCRRGGGTSSGSRQTGRAGPGATYEPAYGRCRSPGSAAEGSRPMRDSERRNERNPS